jgi:hypothetical protein
MRDVTEAITGRERSAFLDQRIEEVEEELRRMKQAESLYRTRAQDRADRDVSKPEPRPLARAEVELWSTPESGVPLER